MQGEYSKSYVPGARGQQFTLKRKSKPGFLLPLLFPALLPEEAVRTVSSALLPLPGRGFTPSRDGSPRAAAAVPRAGVSGTDRDEGRLLWGGGCCGDEAGAPREGRLYYSHLSAGTSPRHALSLQASGPFRLLLVSLPTGCVSPGTGAWLCVPVGLALD